MDEELSKEQIENLLRSLEPLPAGFADLANAIRSNLSAQKDSASALNDVGNSAKNFSNVLDDVAESNDKASKSTVNNRRSEEQAFNSSINALENFGNALTTAHPTLSTFKSTVQSGTDAVAEMASEIPLFGEAVALAIKAMGAVTGAYFDQFSQQVDFGTKMRRMGVTVGETTDGVILTTDKLTDLARESGYTGDKLIELSNMLEGAGPSIALFGSGMTDGMGAFTDYIKLTKSTQMGMRQLGYTYEEVNEVQIAYLELQRASGINLKSQNITAETLQKRSLNYAKSLTVISELTGKSAEAQMKDAEAARASYRNKMANLQEDQEIANLKKQAAVEGISEEQKASLTARAKMLQDEKDARNMMFGTISQILGPDLAEQFNTVAITGNFDSTTEGLAQLGMSVGEITESFKNLDPNDATAMMEASAGIIGEMTEGQADAIARYGESIIRMGDDAESFGKRMGLGGDQLDAFLRLKEAGDADGVSKMIMDAQKEVTKTQETGRDGQLTLQGAIETTVRSVKSFSDGLLDKAGPIAMAASTVAIVAMGIAAGKAAISLGMMTGGKGGMLNFFKKAVTGGGTQAGRTAIKAGSTVSKVVKGGGAIAALTSIIGGVSHMMSDTQRANDKLDNGQIDETEASRRKTVGRAEGTGQALGGVGGAVVGMKAGAMLGAFGGPVGAAIGGVIGAGIGAWMGGAAGKDAAGAMAGGMTKTINADVKKAQLALADQSGLYDKKGIGRESTIDWEKFEAMQADNSMTPEMIQSIIQDNDVSDEDENKLTKILAWMDKKSGDRPEVPQVEIAKIEPEVPQPVVTEIDKELDDKTEGIVILDDTTKVAADKVTVFAEEVVAASTALQDLIDPKTGIVLGSSDEAQGESFIDPVSGLNTAYGYGESTDLTRKTFDTKEEADAYSMTDAMASTEGKELQAMMDANFAEMMAETANDPVRPPVDHVKMDNDRKMLQAAGGRGTTTAFDPSIASASTLTENMPSSVGNVDIARDETKKEELLADGAANAPLGKSGESAEMQERLLIATETQNMLLGQLVSKQEEGNNLNEKLVQYSSVS